MKNGLISGLALNGAGLIHDAEIAMAGHTSEDVEAGIGNGSFGMSVQTAELFASVAELASKESIGLGQAAGIILDNRLYKFRRYSLLAACHRYRLPAMIHMAVDTDIICQHPDYDAAAAAEASHHDFKILAYQISQGENGGVFINIGSAVLLPEVFLKALTVSRNIYGRPHKIITANFDMISHYRPVTNVVYRPTMSSGTGYNFVGHHEIMIPLLAWGLKAEWKKKRNSDNRTVRKRS
jgi:hypothetical protein